VSDRRASVIYPPTAAQAPGTLDVLDILLEVTAKEEFCFYRQGADPKSVALPERDATALAALPDCARHWWSAKSCAG
jgi:hypothetical protein